MDISSLDKAEVLATLYNRSKTQGMGMFDPDANSGPMGIVEARSVLDGSFNKYFDYLKGRVMKIDLSGDDLDTYLYNRDNGANAAEEVLAVL